MGQSVGCRVVGLSCLSPSGILQLKLALLLSRVAGHRRASCRLPLAAVGRHSKSQPIRNPHRTSQQQPSKKEHQLPAPALQAPSPHPSRRLAASRAWLFVSPPSFQAHPSIHHPPHHTITHAEHSSHSHTHPGASRIPRYQNRQDAEMYAPNPQSLPPTQLTNPFHSLLRLLRRLPHPRLHERAQSPQQRPQPPAQRRRLLPACASPLSNSLPKSLPTN